MTNELIQLIGIATIIVTLPTLLLWLKKKFEQDINRTFDKLKSVEDQIRQPESFNKALDLIGALIKKLLDRTKDIESENVRNGIEKFLYDLANAIPKIEEGDKDYDIKMKIDSFESKFNNFKNFLSNQSNLSDLNREDPEFNKINDAWKPEIEKIQTTTEFVKEDLRQITVLTKRFDDILTKQKQNLEDTRKNLNDFIAKDLKGDIEKLKNREKKDFEEITEQFLHSFDTLKRELKDGENKSFDEMKCKIESYIGGLKELKDNFSMQLKTQQETIDRFEMAKSDFQDFSKDFPIKLKELNEQNNNFKQSNKNVTDIISPLRKSQSNLEKLQSDFENLKLEISDMIKNQNGNFSRSNNNLQELVNDIKRTRLDFEDIKTKFEDIKTEITKGSISFYDNIKNLKGIIDEIKNTDSLYLDLKEKLTNMLTSLKIGLENKIKEIEEIPAKLEKHLLEEFTKKINEIIDKSSSIKKENQILLDFIKEKIHLDVPQDMGSNFINRIREEPVFSEDYRLLAIRYFEDLMELEKEYQDKWFWKFIANFTEQLDSLIPKFLYDEGKTIYEVYLNKPDNFNLKDVKENDLKSIINQHHWVQIWEPLLRWTNFFRIYLPGEEEKYLIELHQYYAAKIMRLFQETLGYTIELFSPMEMIPKKMVEKGQIREVSEHFVFFQQIFPHIKHFEEFRIAEEELKLNPDKSLILFVDQVGFSDKNKKIRESKLLFYSPLVMKHLKE